MMTDTFCLEENYTNPSCAEDFSFFATEYEFSPAPVLGLSPPDPTYNGPSYVSTLYNAGRIAHSLVSF